MLSLNSTLGGGVVFLLKKAARRLRATEIARAAEEMQKMLAVLVGATWDWSSMAPIGFIQSVYPTKFGTPRQGAVVPDAVATLRLSALDASINPKQALEGLEEYSHLWLIWSAHTLDYD